MAKNILELPPVSEAMNRGYSRMTQIARKKDPKSRCQIAPWPTWAIVYGAGLMAAVPACEHPWVKIAAKVEESWPWLTQPLIGPLPCGCRRTYDEPIDGRDWVIDSAAEQAYIRGADILESQAWQFYTPSVLGVVEHLWSHHRGSKKAFECWDTSEIASWVRSLEAAPVSTRFGFSAEDSIRARGFGIFL